MSFISLRSFVLDHRERSFATPDRYKLAVVPALYIAMFALLPATSAPAPSPTEQRIGPSSVTLSGAWEFRTGDESGWAAPEYDDSGWEKISVEKPWGAQGHEDHTGFAWYRRRIAISIYPGAPKLGILIPDVDDQYELYWNCRKVGNYGSPPPHAWWYRPRPVSFRLPQPSSGSLEGVLALRVWKRPPVSNDLGTSGGLSAPPVIGDTVALETRVKAARAARIQMDLPNLLIGAIISVTGFLALAFYMRGRQDRVYLWCSLYLLGIGLDVWVPLIGPWKIVIASEQVVNGRAYWQDAPDREIRAEFRQLVEFGLYRIWPSQASQKAELRPADSGQSCYQPAGTPADKE